MTTSNNYNVVVLISGKGSNLQALINATKSSQLPIKISGVISSQPNVYGLQRAKDANIPHSHLSPKDFQSRDAYDITLGDLIDQYKPNLIILAGFMRILGKAFLERFQDKIINIHPSLLPLYPGINTHQQVLHDKRVEHGCSIHFVTTDLDAGPIIAQAAVEVSVTDDIETLQQKVHTAEHFLYPTIVNWFAHKRVSLEGNTVVLDSTFPVPKTGLCFKLNL